MGWNDDRKFCCGFLKASSSFLTLSVFDFLILSYAFIFTITNLSEGESNYCQSTACYSVPYVYLVPFLVIEAFWLFSLLFALIGIKCVPYLQVLYLINSVLVLSASLTLTINAIRNFMNSISMNISWSPALILVLSNGFFLFECYFLYIKFIFYKMNVRKRKAVSTSEKGMRPVNMNIAEDAYSTRSTVIVTDDYLPTPPP